MHVKTTEIGVKLWSVIASHTGWPDLFLRTICLMRLHKKLINQNKNQKLATKLLIIEPADVDWDCGPGGAAPPSGSSEGKHTARVETESLFAFHRRSISLLTLSVTLSLYTATKNNTQFLLWQLELL